MGSSPRVRGKQQLHKDIATLVGLIPACAGKTRPHSHHRAGSAAHPRVCGENPRCTVRFNVPGGSSPRVRGKHRNDSSDLHTTRLIPACAGKTPALLTSRGARWAHPRVCGENVCPSWFLWPWLGSSPRVRGKPPSKFPKLGPGGLIPACAGKTKTLFLSSMDPRAHPRVCGENSHRKRLH